MKKVKILSLLPFLLVFVFSFLIPNFNCLADEGDNTATEIQVSPVRFDWGLIPGENKNGVIRLKNYAEADYKITVSAEDFYVTEDSSQANFYVPSENHPLRAYDVINWIRFDEKEFIIKAGESKDFHFGVSVPEKTPTGGYYGGVFIAHEKIESESKQSENTQLKINTRVGVLLVLGVQGDSPVIQNASLKSFEPERKIFWNDPAKISASVINSGNLQYKMSGKIGIYHSGKVVTSIDLPSRVVYPNKYRPFGGEWKFGLFDFGLYEARVDLLSDDEKMQLEGVKHFYVIPAKTTVVFFSFVIILISVVYLKSKLSGKRKKNTKKNNEKN
ncbi:MAG: hypothetical protein HGA61_01690 [Candidatus Moranbacteria bacterium]|nr:hypothetical protein [Candidatus Moranbacteria bacterium]